MSPFVLVVVAHFKVEIYPCDIWYAVDKGPPDRRHFFRLRKRGDKPRGKPSEEQLLAGNTVRQMTVFFVNPRVTDITAGVFVSGGRSEILPPSPVVPTGP